MPMYEYQCADCGETFERLVRISEADRKQQCPRCKSKETSRIVSLFATSGVTRPATTVTSSGCGTHGGFS